LNGFDYKNIWMFSLKITTANSKRSLTDYLYTDRNHFDPIVKLICYFKASVLCGETYTACQADFSRSYVYQRDTKWNITQLFLLYFL